MIVAPSPGLARGADRAVVGLDNGPADAEAQAGAAADSLARPHFVFAIKPVEDVRQMIGLDADAIVSNGQPRLLPLVVAGVRRGSPRDDCACHWRASRAPRLDI